MIRRINDFLAGWAMTIVDGVFPIASLCGFMLCGYACCTAL